MGWARANYFWALLGWGSCCQAKQMKPISPLRWLKPSLGPWAIHVYIWAGPPKNTKYLFYWIKWPEIIICIYLFCFIAQ